MDCLFPTLTRTWAFTASLLISSSQFCPHQAWGHVKSSSAQESTQEGTTVPPATLCEYFLRTLPAPLGPLEVIQHVKNATGFTANPTLEEISSTYEIITRRSLYSLSQMLSHRLLNRPEVSSENVGLAYANEKAYGLRELQERLLLDDLDIDFTSTRMRPKYGYFVMKKSKWTLKDPQDYGKVGLILKPEVSRRATFFSGDTDNIFSPNDYLSMRQVHSAEDIPGIKRAFYNTIENNNKGGDPEYATHYLEAQIWGDITPKDISAVLIPPSGILHLDLFKKAAQYGFDIYVEFPPSKSENLVNELPYESLSSPGRRVPVFKGGVFASAYNFLLRLTRTGAKTKTNFKSLKLEAEELEVGRIGKSHSNSSVGRKWMGLVRLMQEIKPQGTFNFVKKYLNQEQFSKKLRRRAIAVVADYRSPTAIELLKKTLLLDEDGVVREIALVGLVRNGGLRGVRNFLTDFANEQNLPPSHEVGYFIGTDVVVLLPYFMRFTDQKSLDAIQNLLEPYNGKTHISFYRETVRMMHSYAVRKGRNELVPILAKHLRQAKK